MGWANETPEVLRKELVARMSAIPYFVESAKQLAAIVAEKPRVEVYSYSGV